MRRAVLAAITAAGCARSSSELDLADVKRDDLVVTVDVAGELAAVDSTDITPPAIPQSSSFKIAWLAPEGSEVTAGAPVVTFDASDLERNLEGLRGQLDRWTAMIDETRERGQLASRAEELTMLEQEVSVQRATRLASAPADLVTKLAMRGNQLDEQQAKAELEQARKRTAYQRLARAAELQSMANVRASLARQIDELQHSIARLRVTSPRAGTVVYATNYAGDKRKVGDPAYSSDTVVQVVALGAMIGNGHIDEVDLARVAVHAPVALAVDAFPDARLRGTIASIADSVQPSDADPRNVVRLQIAIESTRGLALRPGMRFRGQIESERIPDVVQVPADAVFVTPDGPVAYREAAGSIERVRLALGRRSTEAIEVTSGLSPGDRVSRSAPAQEAP